MAEEKQFAISLSRVGMKSSNEWSSIKLVYRADIFVLLFLNSFIYLLRMPTDSNTLGIF